jgi:His/Glu/Gln/Arg/opine family amino acid ABC transporter permease subunit
MTFYSNLLQYWPFLLRGLGWTLIMSLGIMVGGSVVGLLCAVGRTSRNSLLRGFIAVYSNIFRSTPPLVQLLLIFYAFPVLTGYSFNGIQSGLIGLSLYAGAYLAEVFRAGIGSVAKGQMEAAEALAMPATLAFFRIVLPQAIRNMLPALTSNAIIIVKDSALLSFVSVSDLMRNGQVVASVMHRSMEVLTVVAVLYLLVTAPLAILSHFLAASRMRARS